MKLETEAEQVIARLAFAMLEARLIALVTHERFAEVALLLHDAKAAAGAVLALHSEAEDLCRCDLGMPPRAAQDGLGIQ
jgi:hypothetical protein